MVEQLIRAFPYLAVGLMLVTLIDTAGAYASRLLNFNYGFFAIVSLIMYTFIGYYVSQITELSIAVLVSLVIAFYDATIGWKLSRKLKAKTGLSDEQLQSITTNQNLAVMLIVSMLFTFIGYVLS